MLFNSIIRNVHFYTLILVVLLSLYTLPIVAQNEKPSKVQFGDFIQLSSTFGYFPYETESLNVYNILYFDQSALISLNKLFSIGLNYNYIDITDSFQERNKFFRASAFLRLSEYSYNDRLIFSGDIIGSYGNFIIELDEALNKRNIFYAGIRFNVQYEVFSKLYLQAGYKLIRQLEKGDYGLENYPYLGLSYRIPTRKR